MVSEMRERERARKGVNPAEPQEPYASEADSGFHARYGKTSFSERSNPAQRVPCEQ